MIVLIVGSVGPGASPMPEMPSSVCTSTTSPEADWRTPPGHVSGSRMGVRTAVVVTLVILTGDGKGTRRGARLSTILVIVDNHC